MSMIETPLMRGLERVLDRSAYRHQVIASNLANVDTPGFKDQQIEFAVQCGEIALHLSLICNAFCGTLLISTSTPRVSARLISASVSQV